MNLARILARSARTFPERPALLVGAKCVLTYAALAARVARMAGYLRQNLGLAPGDRVAIYMGNSPEYLESLFGVLWAGLVVVPVNAKLHPREVAWIVANAQARLVCVSPELAAGLAGALDESGPAVPLLMPGDGHYLRAVSALAIPVLIHLFQLRRFKRIDFPNVRFLAEVSQQTRARKKVQHWLVLLARCLAIAALGLAG